MERSSWAEVPTRSSSSDACHNFFRRYHALLISHSLRTALGNNLSSSALRYELFSASVCSPRRAVCFSFLCPIVDNQPRKNTQRKNIISYNFHCCRLAHRRTKFYALVLPSSSSSSHCRCSAGKDGKSVFVFMRGFKRQIRVR